LTYEFKLPDLGEGVAEGEILKWMVRVGDVVKEDQPLVEVMTDKVNVQIPSPRSGKIASIGVKEGEVAKVGQTLVVIDDGEGGAPAGAQKPASPSTPPASQPAPQGTSVRPPQRSGGAPETLAAPATRRLARELGVELAGVSGSGPHGRVTDDDVKRAASMGRPAGNTQVAVPAPETRGGPREEVVPLRGMRKTIAERMARSSQTVAQVTHVDEADMTELVLLREAFKGSAQKRGVKLTYLPFVIKAVVPALKEFPYVNSSLDEQAGAITLKKYYNIGIATDTEQGLVVPVVRDADRKDIFEIAGEVERLASKAKAGQLALEDVRGSTFTITNVGAIGGLFATPIVNLPEVAILGLHKIAKRPVVREGKVEIRDTTYLSLSFDHRVFDGAYAARFTSRVIDTLQDTKKLLAEVV
jgi:2-oxoglutarate dehydrogenase complex dihydrolipoamide succinyltransferase (E2) component